MGSNNCKLIAFLLLLLIFQIVVIHISFKKFAINDVAEIYRSKVNLVDPVAAEQRNRLLENEKGIDDGRKYVYFVDHLPFWRLEKDVLDEEDMKEANCPHTNCVFTNKNDILTLKLHNYDAIVFNVWYKDSEMPANRTPRQHYIFATTE